MQNCLHSCFLCSCLPPAGAAAAGGTAACTEAAASAADAAAGTAVPETFADYLEKWVYSVQDNDALLDKVGGARLAGLRVVPGLGYAGKI